jgi:hypothetical protein
MFQSGDSVIVVLHTPREKVFGILREISGSGIFVRGIDLHYFDEWTNAIRNGEPYLPMQDYFLPMWRVERMTRDEDTFEIPSMAAQFRQRTGRDLAEQ